MSTNGKIPIWIDRSVADELVKYVDTYAPLLRACAIAAAEALSTKDVEENE